MTPLGRPGTVNEVGAAALFLARDGASYDSAHTLHVAGGRRAISACAHALHSGSEEAAHEIADLLGLRLDGGHSVFTLIRMRARQMAGQAGQGKLQHRSRTQHRIRPSLKPRECNSGRFHCQAHSGRGSDRTCCGAVIRVRTPNADV